MDDDAFIWLYRDVPGGLPPSVDRQKLSDPLQARPRHPVLLDNKSEMRCPAKPASTQVHPPSVDLTSPELPATETRRLLPGDIEDFVVEASETVFVQLPWGLRASQLRPPLVLTKRRSGSTRKTTRDRTGQATAPITPVADAYQLVPPVGGSPKNLGRDWHHRYPKRMYQEPEHAVRRQAIKEHRSVFQIVRVQHERNQVTPPSVVIRAPTTSVPGRKKGSAKKTRST